MKHSCSQERKSLVYSRLVAQVAMTLTVTGNIWGIGKYKDTKHDSFPLCLARCLSEVAYNVHNRCNARFRLQFESRSATSEKQVPTST